MNASWRGASDSITDSSVLSNPADAQNVSCLGLCGRDICPKAMLNMGWVFTILSCKYLYSKLILALQASFVN